MPAWLLIILLLAYPMISVPIMQFMQVRKAFQSNPSSQKKQNYEITENGVKNYGEGFNVDIGWENITRIETSKDFILLFISKNCAYYLPKELVTNEEYEKIRQWKS